MINVVPFYFPRFGENTYLIFDHSKDCIIVDPGCYTPEEQSDIFDYIQMLNLNPVALVNTHAHIDHVLGNQFFLQAYNINLNLHKEDYKYLKAMPSFGKKYDLEIVEIPESRINFIEEGDTIQLGHSSFEVLFTPGHTPGSISLLCEDSNVLISGDIVFNNRIGRVDLPGGNMEVLLDSLHNKVFTLKDDIKIYPGHGASTTVGYEKANNLEVCNWA